MLDDFRAPPGVKVCGLTRPDEARAAADAGADWIGLNFYPASPRFVEIETAAAIVAALPAGVQAVGLFVDCEPGEIVELATRLGLELVQLHGAEPPATIAALKAAGLGVVRAVRLGNDSAFDQLDEHLDAARALGAAPDAVLADAFVPGQAGGTGHTIAATLLDRLARWPAHGPRLVLAGGLTPENVAERVAWVRPWMVDVASGVESAPGRKDAGRVAAFVQAARSGSGPGIP